MTGTIESDSQTDCFCCGNAFVEEELVRLQCHSEVAVCLGCVDWLAAQRQGLARAVPVLATGNVDASRKFWRAAGFDVEAYSDDFAIAARDGVEFHLVEPHPSGRDRGEAYLHVRDVDGVHAAWSAAGLPVTEVRDEPWGMREFNVVDPGGNRIRVGQNA
jgi:catechol 2,3-dioxygenase-like lactoylglutathione lyase family enzyme